MRCGGRTFPSNSRDFSMIQLGDKHQTRDNCKRSIPTAPFLKNLGLRRAARITPAEVSFFPGQPLRQIINLAVDPRYRLIRRPLYRNLVPGPSQAHAKRPGTTARVPQDRAGSLACVLCLGPCSLQLAPRIAVGSQRNGPIAGQFQIRNLVEQRTDGLPRIAAVFG